MKNFDINAESTYKFKIMNYTTTDVDWDVTTGGGTRGTELDADGGEHAYVEMSGNTLSDIIQNPALVPYIYLTNSTLIAKGYDVLIEVTETCNALDESVNGYYFVVFKALDARLNLYNVKLGTFKEYNDFVLAHELVKNITDAYGNSIFEWDDLTSAWTATTEANTLYGITSTADLSIEVDSNLIFSYDTEESFGENLYRFKAGDNLDPVGYTATETGINWWNLGTDLQVDKKAQFKVTVKYGTDTLVEGTADVLVLSTANSIHPLHKADGSLWTPVDHKDGWFYSIAE